MTAIEISVPSSGKQRVRAAKIAVDIMRMSEACAKMHLREHVREDDINMAIRVMLESFIQVQKYSIRNTLQDRFKSFVIHGKEHNLLLLNALETMMKNKKIHHYLSDIVLMIGQQKKIQ